MSVETENDELKGLIPFPCCPQEKVFVYESSRGRASSRCPRCRKFVLFDYGSMTARIVRPIRGAMSQQIHNGAYRLS